MTSTKKIEGQRVLDRVRPAVITGIVLCLANYGMDLAIPAGNKLVENDRQ
jgi:hypothetical protein